MKKKTTGRVNSFEKSRTLPYTARFENNLAFVNIENDMEWDSHYVSATQHRRNVHCKYSCTVSFLRMHCAYLISYANESFSNRIHMLKQSAAGFNIYPSQNFFLFLFTFFCFTACHRSCVISESAIYLLTNLGHS